MEQRDMKTVFVLDRSAKFIDKCGETFDFTVREGAKQKKLQIEKTIWTWCLEGVFEAHRILSDVYPHGTLPIRFAVADFMGKMLDSEWKDGLLTRDELGKIIESVKRPTAKNADITPIGGLTMAIEALAVETPEQREHNYRAKYETDTRTELNSEVKRFTRELLGQQKVPIVENNGNLVLYTRLKTDEEMLKLQQEIVNLVVSRNKIASSPSNKTFCPITSLRVFLVNYYVNGEECTVKTRPLQSHPSLELVKFWVISRTATDMADAVHSLLLEAFDLSSTTVTRIPMKEDNRGSSNYDVELFHSASVHTLLKDRKLIQKESKNATSDKGVTYDTMRLGWTTAPKTKWSLFPHHRAAVPFTTVTAYSRPSACLTQFVRDGRCVMLDLELNHKTCEYGMNMPDKLVSHLLVANRGRIFIQEVDFVQKKKRFVLPLKTPRSLRPPKQPLNMGQLKHMYNQMEIKFIAKNRQNDEITEQESEKWKTRNSQIEQRLMRISRNIAMFAKDTFIFHDDVRPKLEPLITTITHVNLSDTDVQNCKTATARLLQMRDQKEWIVPADSQLGQCSVVDVSDAAEQMRVAIVELAKHMMKYNKYSERHETVYRTFVVTLGADKLVNLEEEKNKKLVPFPFFGRLETPTESQIDENESPLDQFLRKRRLETKNEELKKKNKGLKTDVKEKPMVMAKEVKIDIFANICEMIERKESRIRREFVGRAEHGNKAPLYAQLMERLERPASPSSAERTNERVRNADRGGSGTPPPSRRPYN